MNVSVQPSIRYLELVLVDWDSPSIKLGSPSNPPVPKACHHLPPSPAHAAPPMLPILPKFPSIPASIPIPYDPPPYPG